MRNMGIFFLTLFISIHSLFYIIPIILGDGGVDFAVTVVGTLLCIIGSFIITQLFYIIELLKKNKR